MPSQRRTLSPAHERLGIALKAARNAAGVSTRAVPRRSADQQFYSSGHISLVERGLVTASADLVASYRELGGDDGALPALYQQVVAHGAEATLGRLRGEEQRDTQRRNDVLTALSDQTTRHDVQRHYVVQTHAAHYSFGPNGEITRVDCTVRMRALHDGVEYYYVGHNYPADERRGVLEVEAGNGVEIAMQRESPSGALQTYMRLASVLDRDAPGGRDIHFRLHVRSDKRSAARLRYHAADGNQQVAVAATFTPPALPATLWWFAAPDLIDSEHPQHEHDLPAAANHRYEHAFDHLIPSWSYGLGWVWTPDSRH